MKLGIDDRDPREADPLDFDDPRGREEAGFSDVASKIGTKNLLIIIVTMPFVFLLVVMSIIAVFGKPGEEDVVAENASRAVPAASLEQPSVAGQRVVLPVPAAAEDAAGAIALPEGARPGEMSLDGDRLAVRVDTDEGAMIVIYDLEDRAVVQTVPLVEAAVREE